MCPGVAVPDMGVKALSVALRGLYGDIPRTPIFGNGHVTSLASTTPYAATHQNDQGSDQHKHDLQKKILDKYGP